MPWQEICFFSTYRGPFNLFDLTPNRHSRYYELASPYRIIRWRHRLRINSQMPTRPELDQQAYDRWHQQLLGYIRGRTGLPLVGLDRVPVPTGKR
ncbi:hypothetical protein KDH_22690 [Dictyobacter sp. S3.2.2.5]|uniref:Uncharacterized protein n=1 Tax=Dictyobacter halimunensis TaxID=3026934 RepID=A0ABQ6FP37_9CHLR|nr:hypothetical protein KDH_22690 [Dictyobacter sp. S3.2.2.5]